MRQIRLSARYELRLLFTSGDKKQYATEEIAEFLDKIAMAKGQE